MLKAFSRTSLLRIAKRNMTTITGRQPSAEEKTVIDEVLSLYQLKPTGKIYIKTPSRT